MRATGVLLAFVLAPCGAAAQTAERVPGRVVAAIPPIADLSLSFAPAQTSAPLASQSAVKAPSRPGLGDVHEEVVLDARVQRDVPERFDSFQDYMDKMLHHPDWGYYTSGRVRFVGEAAGGGDFTTYPTSLSPYFGQMIAEQAYRMWDGMRQAGSLSDGERFTVAEFGGGTGRMARDFLEYVHRKADEEKSPQRAAFARQVQYVLYERSPALRERQLKMNARFPDNFRSEAGDARDPLSSIPESSVKGLVVSNELPDAFGAHKVVLSKEGKAEAAFVIPRIKERTLRALESEAAPDGLLEKIRSTDRSLRLQFGLQEPSARYLDRENFDAVMSFLSTLPYGSHRRLLRDVGFQETYVPAALVPALAAHLERNSVEYKNALSQTKGPSLVYVNLAADGYIGGVARVLKSGYAMTIDYGHTILDLLQRPNGHFRTYGGGAPGINDAYAAPSFMDMTTDQDFTALAEEGRRAGLRTIHFGPQGDLAASLGVGKGRLARYRREDVRARSFLESLWTKASSFGGVGKFLSGSGSFQILVQQKEGTDPAYVFPAQENGAASDPVAPAREASAGPISPRPD